MADLRQLGMERSRVRKGAVRPEINPSQIRGLLADLGTGIGLPFIDAASQAAQGNYGQAAVSGLLDAPPVKMAGMALAPLIGMVRKAAPMDEALRIAQKNAAKPVSKGGLGLPPDNTPMDRARAMGANVPVYHSTKQDIKGGLVPGYADGLIFTTPDPQFANKWVGKGKYRKRIGAEAEEDAVGAERQRIKNETHDWERLNQLSGDDFNAAFDKMDAEFKRRYAKEVGIYDSQVHASVYPMTARVEKTFIPDRDIADLQDYFDANKINDTTREYFNAGAYLPYEDAAVIGHLKGKGYDSIMLKENHGPDNPYTTLAVFDPSRIRSRFAAFDPARINENNLLASLAALGISIPVMRGLLQEEVQ